MPQSSTEPRNQGIQSKNPIRIVIGEDTFLMREALERIVSGFDYIDAVALCGDRDSLVAAIEEEQPDAVLTDIRMPPTGTDEGIEAAAWIREHHPQVAVVVLSQYTAAGNPFLRRSHGQRTWAATGG